MQNGIKVLHVWFMWLHIGDMGLPICLSCGFFVFLSCANADELKRADRPLEQKPGIVSVPRTATRPPKRSHVSRVATALAPETKAVLVQALVDKDWLVRLTATLTLSRFPRNEALRHLEQRLGDPEPEIRAAAIEQLGVVASPRAVALLRSVQNDESEELSIRTLAAAAMITPANHCR